MTETLDASSPVINATVAASAGTGKTWLLVTRIIRLLLNDAPAENILSITFTRKAAAEMQIRLSQRLFEFAQCDDKTLVEHLEYINVKPTAAIKQQARQLYEKLLRNTHSIKATTFHSFCQDILRKFPLEADIPPGFDLLEQTSAYQQEAIETLFTEATKSPDNEIAHALETLFDQLKGLANTQTALNEILNSRSDWWAYTLSQADPVEYAINKLKKQLGINPDEDPIQDYITDTALLTREFGILLGKHTTKKNEEHCNIIADNISVSPFTPEHFIKIKSVYLTQKNQPLARKKTKTLEKSLGSEQQERFIELHEILSQRTMNCLGRLALQHSYAINIAWYTAGNRLIDLYQHLKEEQRLLDFTDLEWKTYLLLSESHNAHWVQYKLDQRIEHILIDEFQDTNPTQWQLLLPLLEEISASDNERQRSVFLVGDGKQSIYRFRRAEPRLFKTAANWMNQHLAAESFGLDKSRRSAQAIMEFVNKLFSDGPLASKLSAFHQHSTTLDEVWGRVEMLPLVDKIDDESEALEYEGLRNPLEHPRIIYKDTRYYREGLLIGDRIQSLIDEKTIITKEDQHRYLAYHDIIILVQTRTHIKDYETALRDKGIPYLGMDRGTLLESLEVRDIIALLDTLVTPDNKLSLAVTLKSPLFNCSDEDLMLLASMQSDKSWYERLQTVTADLDKNHTLCRAYHWLSTWRTLVGHLPVHDLLDRIYSEGNLIAHFEAAFPAHLQPRIRANLTRFIELALEVDSGRYPSLTHFLSRLRHARANSKDAPDEGQANTQTDCIRIMTIHGSKGLEAPAIFLADASSVKSPKYAYHPLVNWPPEKKCPDYFILMGPKETLDPVTREHLDHHLAEEDRENANLLYVALTRARQLLVISGCVPSKTSNLGWYGLIKEQLAPDDSSDEIIVLTKSGDKRASVTEEPKTKAPTVTDIDPRLSKPNLIAPSSLTPLDLSQISPSQLSSSQITATPSGTTTSISEESEGQLRGTIIHRMLEVLTSPQSRDASEQLKQVSRESQIPLDNELLNEWWQEALGVVKHPDFSYLFDPSQYKTAHNEAPIQYRTDNMFINGVIDRLVVCDKVIYLLDYKTHRGAEAGKMNLLAEQYKNQMALYKEGVSKIWPDKTVRPLLLFTASKSLYEC